MGKGSPDEKAKPEAVEDLLAGVVSYIPLLEVS